MWVSHSLEQGDIGRILEPLLLLLLHPSTARVSHYFVEKEKTKVETHLHKREDVETEEGTENVGGGEQDGEKSLDGEGEGVKEDLANVEKDPKIEMNVKCGDSKDSMEEISTGRCHQNCDCRHHYHHRHYPRH